MFGLGLQELVLIAIIGLILMILILPFWKIFAKAGFSGWLSFTQIVPVLNFVVLLYVAFAEWPVHRELERLKERAAVPPIA